MPHPLTFHLSLLDLDNEVKREDFKVIRKQSTALRNYKKLKKTNFDLKSCIYEKK